MESSCVVSLFSMGMMAHFCIPSHILCKNDSGGHLCLASLLYVKYGVLVRTLGCTTFPPLTYNTATGINLQKYILFPSEEGLLKWLLSPKCVNIFEIIIFVNCYTELCQFIFPWEKKKNQKNEEYGFHPILGRGISTEWCCGSKAAVSGGTWRRVSEANKDRPVLWWGLKILIPHGKGRDTADLLPLSVLPSFLITCPLLLFRNTNHHKTAKYRNVNSWFFYYYI